MKKLLLILTVAILFPFLVNAGGIVTNTNQSAIWVRTLARDASTDIDAAYFNPAGLVRLDDGFHFSLNNQTIWQNKDVTTDYRYLLPDSSKTFAGKVSAPVFPSIYGAWKKGKFAISLGFNPIGGGGGATLEEGIPMVDILVADLRKGYELQAGATDYRMDAYMKGSSVFYGYQAAFSYAINDMISIAAGLRYVTAKNTYEGHLRDVELLLPTGWAPAADLVVASANMVAQSATNLQNAIDLGLLGANDPISVELGLQLQMLGINPTGFTNTIAVGALQQASDGLNDKAGLLTQELESVQKGSGFTPFVGAHFSLLENKLNIGVKYEFKTAMKLKNDTEQDFTVGFTDAGVPITMFPDGQEFDSDIPAMLSVGVDYQIIKKLSASVGFHYFFDKSANYGKKLNGVYVPNDSLIDKNYIELSAGLEFNITDKLVASAGYLYAKSGVKEEYQDELSFSLPSSTIGAGLGYKISKDVMVNLAAAYAMYGDGKKDYEHVYPGPGNEHFPVRDNYTKNTLIIAIGLDLHF
ncbi:MAG: outer membrane protein transport protein [Bacteroidales bacterium]|nr:outer membrane protein transport protein [Bacteroidales bacterium]